MSSILWHNQSNQSPLKLTAIGLWKDQKHPFLSYFEEMLGFNLLAKISQTNEFLVKDLISSNDKYHPPTSLDQGSAQQELIKLARSTQSRYVLFGELAIPAPEPLEHQPVTQIKITLKLFDYQQTTIIWEQTIQFQEFLVEDPKQNRLVINIERFNAIVSELSRELFFALLPGHDFKTLELLSKTPITHSYQGLTLLLSAHKKSSVQEKLSLLNEVVKEDPQCELAYYQLGKLYRMERQYEASILNYRKALEHCNSNRSMQALYATDAGIACALLERNDLALQWWQRATQICPNYVNPYFNIANLYEDENDYLKAAEYFQKAQEVAPNDYRTFYNLARIYSKLSDWAKALTQYEQQLTENNNDPWCHSDIATCYLNLGDIENAVKHLERTVDLDDTGEAGEYAKLILTNISA